MNVDVEIGGHLPATFSCLGIHEPAAPHENKARYVCGDVRQAKACFRAKATCIVLVPLEPRPPILHLANGMRQLRSWITGAGEERESRTLQFHHHPAVSVRVMLPDDEVRDQFGAKAMPRQDKSGTRMKQLDEYLRMPLKKDLYGPLVGRLIEARLKRDNNILRESEVLNVEFPQRMVPPVFLGGGGPDLESVHGLIPGLSNG